MVRSSLELRKQGYARIEVHADRETAERHASKLKGGRFDVEVIPDGKMWAVFAKLKNGRAPAKKNEKGIKKKTAAEGRKFEREVRGLRGLYEFEEAAKRKSASSYKPVKVRSHTRRIRR